jgi:hypothetical protein
MCLQQQGSNLKLRIVRKKAKGARQLGFYLAAPAIARGLTPIKDCDVFETK